MSIGFYLMELEMGMGSPSCTSLMNMSNCESFLNPVNDPRRRFGDTRVDENFRSNDELL